MTRTDAQVKNDALDALNKIRAILGAAMYLTTTSSEKNASIELVGLAEEVAIRVLEASR